MATRDAVDGAFRDNFDTPLAVQALLALITATNAYMGTTQPVCPQLLGSGRHLAPLSSSSSSSSTFFSFFFWLSTAFVQSSGAQ